MEVRKGFKQTEIGLIPNDWEIKPIHEFASIKTGPFGTLLKASEYSMTEGVPMISVGEIREGFLRVTDETPRIPEVVARRLPQYLLRKGDIVFGRKGSVDRSALIRQHQHGWFLGSDGMSIRPTLDYHDEYLAYQFQSSRVQEWLLRHAIGTTMSSLNQDVLRNVVIPLPPTKAEQQAIAAALSDVDSLLTSLDNLIAKKRLIKQGAMQELLTGKKRLPGFEKKIGYQQTEVGVIPKDWEARPLLSAVRIAQGQVDPKIEPYKSMTLVGPVHVEGKTGKLIFRQTAEEQGAISGKYLFERGDIVYGKINPHLQKAFLADFSGLCSADMYPLRPQEDVSPGFMLSVILGRQFTKYAVSVSVRSGMPKINRNEMKEFVFPIPVDPAEQAAIAEILSDMDTEIAALEARREKTRLLKQGMMQELLTGRIRLV